MNRKELDVLAARHGLTVLPGVRSGNVIVGFGADQLGLADFVTACHKSGLTGARVTHVSNLACADYGKAYAEVPHKFNGTS